MKTLKTILNSLLFLGALSSSYAQNVVEGEFLNYSGSGSSNINSRNISSSSKGDVAIAYQDRYIKDGTAIAACNYAFGNEINLIHHDEYLAARIGNTTYVFRESMKFTELDAANLKYFQCWVKNDPSDTVVIE